MVIKCLVIGGPTGIGKTSLSIQLARWFKEKLSRNVEIVSCDSVQFYRGLDIGSGKVEETVRLDIPHHLIDCQDVAMAAISPFSAVKFSQLAESCIKVSIIE